MFAKQWRINRAAIQITSRLSTIDYSEEEKRSESFISLVELLIHSFFIYTRRFVSKLFTPSHGTYGTAPRKLLDWCLRDWLQEMEKLIDITKRNLALSASRVAFSNTSSRFIVCERDERPLCWQLFSYNRRQWNDSSEYNRIRAQGTHS